MVHINLLPWREEHRKEKRKEFFALLGMFVLSSLGIIFYIHIMYNGWIDLQKRKNSFLENEITVLDKRIEKIKTLQSEKNRLLARMQVIQQLQHDRPAVVRLFDQLVHIVPEGLYVTHIERKGTNFKLEGKAESNTRVSKLMRNIEQSSSMKNPKLSVIRADDDKSKKQPGSQERYFSLSAIQGKG